jgi:selenocysteine lyase/cysteine desulfurase
MGEYSNFINLPMLKESLRQILEWTPSAIQEYCARLTEPLLQHLHESGFIVEEESFRAKHLFGFRLPAHVRLEDLQQRLAANKVIVSLRGSAVRLSPHLYNDERDVDALMDALKAEHNGY